MDKKTIQKLMREIYKKWVDNVDTIIIIENNNLVSIRICTKEMKN